MKAIVMQAQLTSFSSRADKSLGFRGQTPELSATEAVALMAMQGLNVRLLIEPMDYESDGKTEVKGRIEGKTQSERQRAVLFVWWKQEGEPGTFEDWYRTKMNHVIEGLKNNLKSE